MSTTFISSSSSSSFSFRSSVLCKIFTDELSPMKCAMKSYKGQYFGSPVVSLIMADRYTGDDGVYCVRPSCRWVFLFRLFSIVNIIIVTVIHF